jgi:response regulator of citrate/malate metabolism
MARSFLDNRIFHKAGQSASVQNELYRTIGRAIRASQNTVRKYVAALEDKGLIATQPTDNE